MPLGRACSEPRLAPWALREIQRPQDPPSLSGTVRGLCSEPGLTRPLPVCSPAQSIVSKNALQYRGNAQHDAQEFLLWLLDRVHEDLHHAVKQGGPPPVKVRAPGPLPSSEEPCALHPVNTGMLARLRASAGSQVLGLRRVSCRETRGAGSRRPVASGARGTCARVPSRRPRSVSPLSTLFKGKLASVPTSPVPAE